MSLPGDSGEMPKSAMLLAAGEGTRLRPLTETVPKCMVPVAGKPILAHAVERLRASRVRDITMNLHYLPQVIMDYFKDGSAWGIAIQYSMEPELLGTAGAVGKVREYFTSPFFVWYGDNLSTCRLGRFYAFHRSRRGIATVALYQRHDPTSSGIAQMTGADRIVRFVEKPTPDQVFSHWVNAGIYVLEPGVLRYIPSDRPSDFGRDVFPALLAAGEAVYGYRMGVDEGLWWIDTPEDLERVRRVLQSPDALSRVERRP